METPTMGRVLTEATIENFGDFWNCQQGTLPVGQVRRITVNNALVNTGATLVSLPSRLVRQLGLRKTATKRVISSTGATEADMYSAIQLTIQGRSCTMDVMEVPDDVPVLIGQIPLEHLDLVVDPRDQKLVGNPRHGGEHIYEMY